MKDNIQAKGETLRTFRFFQKVHIQELQAKVSQKSPFVIFFIWILEFLLAQLSIL